jgi:hypothetical protein
MTQIDQTNILVITPLKIDELHSLFDETSIKVINYFLKKSIFSQPEKLPNQEDLPIHIPKEHLEQWICQAIGATPVGAGSYAIDVISNDRSWGADIKMLSCKVDSNGNLGNNDSGETSLAQKFDDNNFGENNTLDNLFSNRQFDHIWNNWKEILLSKYKKVEIDYGITTIYYILILRAGLKFHLCGLKVDLSKLGNTSVNFDRSTSDSIWIKNFIDNNLGHVKIYKAKKRFELRLKPKFWYDNNLVLSFNTEFKQQEESIRDLIETGLLNNHINKCINNIFRTNQ